MSLCQWFVSRKPFYSFDLQIMSGVVHYYQRNRTAKIKPRLPEKQLHIRPGDACPESRSQSVGQYIYVLPQSFWGGTVEL